MRHRYHIGESLLPSVRHYLRFIDAEDKVANFGFARKVCTLSLTRLFIGSFVETGSLLELVARRAP